MFVYKKVFYMDFLQNSYRILTENNPKMYKPYGKNK